MYLIETRNSFSKETEYYIVAAKDEQEAKIKFSLEFPSFKINSITDKSNEIIEVKIGEIRSKIK